MRHLSEKARHEGSTGGGVRAGFSALSTALRRALTPQLLVCPDRLIVFGRFPRVGHTKTRLIGALGATGAARCHRRMSEFIVRGALATARRRRFEVEFCTTDGSAAAVSRWLGPGL